jgi:hypothetical protein
LPKTTVRSAILLLEFGMGVAAAQTPASTPLARRDPFWPLGYAPVSVGVVTNVPVVPPPSTNSPPPVVVAKVVTPEDWAAAEEEVGIRPPRYSLGGRGGTDNFVLVGGRIKSKGDLVLFEKDGVRFTWLVASISRDDVMFERRSAEILPKTGSSAETTR